MPYIHIRALRGRDTETKQKAAEAIVKAASEILGSDQKNFTVLYDDIAPEAWDSEVQQPMIETQREKILYEKGKLVG